MISIVIDSIIMNVNHNDNNNDNDMNLNHYERAP